MTRRVQGPRASAEDRARIVRKAERLIAEGLTGREAARRLAAGTAWKASTLKCWISQDLKPGRVRMRRHRGATLDYNYEELQPIRIYCVGCGRRPLLPLGKVVHQECHHGVYSSVRPEHVAPAAQRAG